LEAFFFGAKDIDENRLENRMIERFYSASIKIKWAYYIEKYKNAKEN